MITRIALLTLGFAHILNGLWMLLAPMSWYAAVPGVSLTGPLNHHFVADIGLAFIASGAGFAWGIRKGAAAFAVAGATWPALHALLHIWGWMENGFPGRVDVAMSELVGVMLVAVIGALAAWRNARKEGML